MKIAVAFDHRGVSLRDAVKEALEGHEVIDLGTHTAEVRIDYPDKARELVGVFLAARFDGGERYVARLEKVAAMEKEMKHGQVEVA
jgi:ribose 5-phosphate isomerase RpiB